MARTPPAIVLRTSRLLIGTLLVTILLAATSNLIIEYLQVGGNGEFVREHTLHDHRGLFVLGTSVIWLVVMLVLALTGRLWLTVGIVLVVSVLVAYANYEKLHLRREPLYPNDLSIGADAGFLTEMVGPRTVLLLAVMSLLILAVSLLTGRVLRRHFRPVRRDQPRLYRAILLGRGATVLVCLLALGYVGQFNTAGNHVRAAFEAEGVQWRWWFQKANYQYNGFVAGTLYNLNVPAMDPPQGYSRARMQDISDKYSTAAARLNNEREDVLADDVNVVVVLSEAFADPLAVEGVRFDEDPIPFTRRLMTSTTSGRMLAQHFGGGTANMEFEVLTGMSLSQFKPQMNTPFQQMVADYDSFPSAVGYFKNRDYRAIAVHPFWTKMYKREQVYPILGIDEFIYDETMASTKRLGKSDFISDASAFQEVLAQIDATAGPLLVNLVTMQNHYPMANLYPDPVGVSGVDKDEKDHAGGWARGLKYSDDALRDFIASLDRSAEKTVVLFYGDHQPAFWGDRVHRLNGERALKETPFFVWSNFREPTPRELPTTSPIHFMPHVFEEIGAEIPPYYALLHALEEEVPAMEHGLMIGPDDRTLAEADLSERAKELLRDYRLVQYDLSVGGRYSQEAMFYPPDEPLSASGSR